MGAITSAVIAVVAVVLGWITIEIACKPCLEQGRQAIDRNLNPDYDPDDDINNNNNNAVREPLNPAPATSTTTTTAAKTVL
ncbi:hypothetical protein P8452_15812 [Trifolium repens]|nr:outer envelope membrane protein [Trifolium repens]WJX26944.1 hypothetical protein P8452_15812 [Trifolium repens]